MTERQILCKIKIGSYLYGTNRPDSDLDFSGVFLPSSQDLLGLQACPGEMSESVKVSEGPRNSKDDVDCKFYSLQKFINLAAQGQPGQLELLFAPPEMYEQIPKLHALYGDAWKEIVNNRAWFLSKKNIWPFIGFALAQAHKTTIKGDNLNALRAIAEWGGRLSPGQRQQPLRDWLAPADGQWRFIEPKIKAPGRWKGFLMAVLAMFRDEPEVAETLKVLGLKFEIQENDRGFDTFRVAGRQYDPGVKVKAFLKNVDELIKRYGTRSEAAAEHGLDYKSLMHAYRLLGQAEELLQTGQITLPRPPAEVKFLMSIRNMQMPADYDWLGEITARIDRIRSEFEPRSSLPAQPAWDKLGRMCRDMLREHIIPHEVKLERSRISPK